MSLPTIVVTTTKENIMKLKETKKVQHYTIKFYTLEYFFEKEYVTCYNDYRTNYIIHSGCCKLEWELKFNSLAKLKQQLRKWYPDEYYMRFYTNLNYIIKGQTSLNKSKFLIIVPSENPHVDFFSVSLKKQKVKNKRPRKWDYDDMWMGKDVEKRSKRSFTEKDIQAFYSY